MKRKKKIEEPKTYHGSLADDYNEVAQNDHSTLYEPKDDPPNEPDYYI